MSILLLFINLVNASPIDSLLNRLEQNPDVQTVLQLNHYYFKSQHFRKGIALLKKYRRYFSPADQLLLMFAEADDYLFAGDIKSACKQYRGIVMRNPDAEIANDALERLYLIETGRSDTTLFKKLIRTMYLYKIRDYQPAIDSLKFLLNSKFGPYAYYYLALIYKEMNDFVQAYATLQQMDKSCPENRIYDAKILQAELAINLDRKKEAKGILENLILAVPNSIYAMQAREIMSKNGLE